MRGHDLEVARPRRPRAPSGSCAVTSPWSDEAVLVLDQQPLLRFLRAHQREGALELLAAQQDAELALVEAFADLALGLARGRGTRWPVLRRASRRRSPRRSLRPRRTGPAGSRPRTRRSRTDGLRSAPPGAFRRVERRALGHRPRLQHAVALEPEVVVQPRAPNAAARRTAAARCRRSARPPARLGGGLEACAWRNIR